MTRAEIKSRIRDAINDPSSVIFTDAQLNDLIEEATQILVSETRSLRKSIVVPRRSGTLLYSTRTMGADELLLPYRIFSNSNTTKLAVTSMEELDRFQSQWMDTTGEPEFWFPVSWDLIGVWPSSSSSGGTLKIDYFAWPGTLDDDASKPELPLASVPSLVLYGEYMGLLKQWDAVRAASVFQRFKADAMLAKSRSGILKIGHRAYGRAGQLYLPTSVQHDE